MHGGLHPCQIRADLWEANSKIPPPSFWPHLKQVINVGDHDATLGYLKTFLVVLLSWGCLGLTSWCFCFLGRPLDFSLLRGQESESTKAIIHNHPSISLLLTWARDGALWEPAKVNSIVLLRTLLNWFTTT